MSTKFYIIALTDDELTSVYDELTEAYIHNHDKNFESAYEKIRLTFGVMGRKDNSVVFASKEPDAELRAYEASVQVVHDELVIISEELKGLLS